MQRSETKKRAPGILNNRQNGKQPGKEKERKRAEKGTGRNRTRVVYSTPPPSPSQRRKHKPRPLATATATGARTPTSCCAPAPPGPKNYLDIIFPSASGVPGVGGAFRGACRGGQTDNIGRREKFRWLASPTPRVKKVTSGRIGVEKTTMGAEKISSPNTFAVCGTLTAGLPTSCIKSAQAPSCAKLSILRQLFPRYSQLRDRHAGGPWLALVIQCRAPACRLSSTVSTPLQTASSQPVSKILAYTC